MLDRDRRGGERLWQRIYEEDDLVAKLEASGVHVSPDKKSPKELAEGNVETDNSESVNSETSEDDDF